jgi:hypothetical protein
MNKFISDNIGHMIMSALVKRGNLEPLLLYKIKTAH